MRRVPDELAALRLEAAATVGWRRRVNGRVRVVAGPGDGAKYGPDPEVMDRLKEAEAAFTATFTYPAQVV